MTTQNRQKSNAKKTHTKLTQKGHILVYAALMLQNRIFSHSNHFLSNKGTMLQCDRQSYNVIVPGKLEVMTV